MHAIHGPDDMMVQCSVGSHHADDDSKDECDNTINDVPSPF